MCDQIDGSEEERRCGGPDSPVSGILLTPCERER